MLGTIIMGAIGLIKEIFAPAAKMVDDLHTSTEEKLQLKALLMELENKLIEKLSEYFTEVLKAQKEIIIAEIKGSWLTRNWRPLLMLMTMAMIFNNYIFVPYLNAWLDWGVTLEIPKDMWTMLQLGVGGYVGGRSVETVVKTIKGKK